MEPQIYPVRFYLNLVNILFCELSNGGSQRELIVFKKEYVKKKKNIWGSVKDKVRGNLA